MSNSAPTKQQIINGVFIVGLITLALLYLTSLLVIGKDWNNLSFSSSLMVFLLAPALALTAIALTIALRKGLTLKLGAALFPFILGVAYALSLIGVSFWVQSTAGEQYSYTAPVNRVVEYKNQGRGNSAVACAHTAHWWDNRHTRYVTTCTDKTMYQHSAAQSPIEATVAASSYLNGMIIRVNKVDFSLK